MDCKILHNIDKSVIEILHKTYLMPICRFSMVPAPRWKVENAGDCKEILRKGIAKGMTNVKVEAVSPAN